MERSKLWELVRFPDQGNWSNNLKWEVSTFIVGDQIHATIKPPVDNYNFAMLLDKKIGKDILDDLQARFKELPNNVNKTKAKELIIKPHESAFCSVNKFCVLILK